jgi:hypothetical protein
MKLNKYNNDRKKIIVGPNIAGVEEVYVIEGNTGTMRCSVRDAFPKATIRWKYTDTQEYLDETSTNGHIKIVADTNNENVDVVHS